MSYYGGGGGWVPPGFYTPNQQGIGPPPIQQPPPTAYYTPDATAYTQGRVPYNYAQAGYGSVTSHPQATPAAVTHPTHPPPAMTAATITTHQTALYSSVPPPQQQALARGASNSPLVSEKGRTSLDRSHDSRSPPRRGSPSPEDRYERRQAGNRHRDLSPDESRYRRRRSPSESPDRPYSREPRPRGRSPENYKRGRKDEAEFSKQILQKSKSDHSGVDLDALLKDERLRNVLFAGISKATAKLEQSLKQDEPKDKIAFHSGSSHQGKSQLFPSASTSGSSQEKPRSILKRKTDSTESIEASAAYSNLTTLEKTLQMLRGKTDPGESHSVSSHEKPETKAELKRHGALGQLVSYDDDNDEEAYLYSSKEPSPTEKKKTSPHPFWSVNAVAASRKEETKNPDTFEMKDKMFERWRQSIQKSPQRQLTKDSPRDQFYEKETRSVASRLRPGKKEENQEELDSTVQNILQSIGFDFDLSQRMQQLARKKKIEEEEKTTGISNMSASFLDKGSILTEELKASLLQSGNDLSKIDSLLQEARASVHLERSGKRRERSPSPATRRDRSPEVGRAIMLKDRLKAKMSLSDWPDQDDEQRQHNKSHVSREYEVMSPSDRRFLEDRRVRSAFRVSETLDDAKDEYFYPEKDLGEIPPGVPLLKSYSSRQKNEDLSSGLLKSLRVENFRVMSRPVYDDENEEFTETRRIILPAKMERKVLSRSPSARESRSPSLRGGQKRSGSPLTMSALKERKVISSRSSSLVEAQQRSPVYDKFRDRFSPISRDSGPESPERSPGYREAARRREIVSPPARRRPSGQRSPSPKSSRWKYQKERSRSPERRRSRSPKRYRSRSPIRRRSRSRSPRRRRSRSHSRPRHRRSPPRQTSPLRARRRPVSRRSPEKDSFKAEAKTSVDKRDAGANTNAKAKRGGQPQTATQVNLSKMTNDERKSHLKKMLIGKGIAAAAAVPVVQKAPPKKETDNVNKIMESFEKLATSFSINSKTELINKLSLLSADDRVKVLDNVKSRFSKIMLLKVEVVKLKKQQNELMRKIQRRGVGPQDPQLSINERMQGKLEKEIERLSAAELNVEVGEFSLEEPDESSEIKSSQDAQPSKPQNKTASKKKTTSGNLITVPLSNTVNTKSLEQKPQQSKATESVSKTDASGKKKTATPVTKEKQKKAQMMPESGKNSWTSVEVEDELPVIVDGDTQKRPASKGKASDSAVKTAPTRKKIYYEYIDGRNHYCRHCHITCQTLNQFFDHSHGKKHARAISKMPKPWDEPRLVKKNQKVGQAQSRRIKGSEMIIPVTGFYCSLCKVYCGDFGVTENHLKSDSHYDKYLDYIRDNPKYEKNLLLEKTKPQPPSTQKSRSPSPPAKEERGREKKAHLRVKTEKEIEKEEEDSGAHDQIGAVDMELDEDDRDDDMDVLSKVPKMVPKSLPFIPPPPPEPAMTNTMKTSKEDKVQPLDSFLTIKQEANGQKTSTPGDKIPVVCTQSSFDLSDIPIPAPMPKPQPVYTVKSLQEVQDEEKKAAEDEKRMMGIDVDAEEEKPLAAIKRPPILQDLSAATVETSEASIVVQAEPWKTGVENLFAKVNKDPVNQQKPNVTSKVGGETIEDEKRMMGIDVDAEEEKPLAAIKRPPMFQSLSTSTSEPTEESTATKSEIKKTSVDSLFAKLNKGAAQKRKPKTVSVVGGETTEMELRIQKEIAEKLNKEKEKLLRKKQKEEEREKRREERRFQKKKIYSSSESSSEESEEEEEEAAEGSVNEKVDVQIPLSDVSLQNLPTEHKPVLEAEACSTISGGYAMEALTGDSSKNEAQIRLGDVTKPDEIREPQFSHAGTDVEVSEIHMEAEEDKAPGYVETVRKGKAPVKKKNPQSGSVLSTESDLFGVFSSSLETISQEARKKLNKKGGVRKRGKGSKASQETDGKEIIMEDYVVLSEVTEEDEVGMDEAVEAKDDGEKVAKSISDDIPILVEKGKVSPKVMEGTEDAAMTHDTLNQELEIETTCESDKENSKTETTLDKELSGDQVLPASTVNQDVFTHELQRDDNEAIPEEHVELMVPVLSQAEEEIQTLSSTVNQEFSSELQRDDNEMMADEHVELLVPSLSEAENPDEVHQGEVEVFPTSTVNEDSFPPELQRHYNEKISDECLELSAPVLSQAERHPDGLQEEEIQMLSSTANQEFSPELQRDDNEMMTDEHVELMVPVLSQAERHPDRLQEEEIQTLSSTVNQEFSPELQRDDNEMMADEHVELMVPVLSQAERHPDGLQEEEIQTLSSTVNQEFSPELQRDDNEMMAHEHVESLVPSLSEAENPDEVHQDEFEALPRSTVNEDSFPPELQRDYNEKISDECLELSAPVLSQGKRYPNELQEEEIQVFSSSTISQEFSHELKRDNEQIQNEHVELSVPDLSQGETHLEDIQQEGVEVLPTFTVNEDSFLPELQRDDSVQIPDEGVELSVPVLSQVERHHDLVQEEELEVLSPSTVNQAMLSPEFERDEHVKLMVPVSSQGEKHADELQQVELEGISESSIELERNEEEMPDESVELTVPDLSHNERPADEVQLEELQVFPASTVNQEVRSESEKDDNEKIPDEDVQLTGSVLSQEMPIVSEQPLQLTAPVLAQEVSLDMENAGEETPPVPPVPASGRGGGRGRGRKSGGRGRGRGKRAAKKSKADESIPTDESLVKSNEKLLELETPSKADTTATSVNEEPENIPVAVTSPSKRGRRAKAATPSRRVTRSRGNQIIDDNLDSVVNEPAKAVVEAEEPDVSVATSSTTIFETDDLPPAGVQSLDEQFSSEVGRESPETMCSPSVSMEDAEMIPSLPEQLVSSDVKPSLDLKDGSDSDATITEDQEPVKSQSIIDDGTNQNTLIQIPPPQMTIMSDTDLMETLEESGNACLNQQSDQNQETPVNEDSSIWNRMYQVESNAEDTSAVTGMDQDMSPLSSHLHANQPIDPPMSGIVSEVEAPDSIMDVDGEGVDTNRARPEVNIPESEGLPTSGLGLDIDDDVTDSISFPLNEDNAKADPSETL